MMKTVDYSDIVFLDKIREIKATIRNSGFRINHQRAYEVDQKMRKIIDHLFDENSEDTSLVHLYHKLDRNIERSVSGTLLVYYFALYHDNLELLRMFLQEGVALQDENDQFCFPLLDREFTKHFSTDQYMFLVQHCREELLHFYNLAFARVRLTQEMSTYKTLMKELNQLSAALFSTEHPLTDIEKNKAEERLIEISNALEEMNVYRYSEQERDTLCHQFAEIMTEKPFICKTGKKGDYRDECYYGLLIPDVITLFGVDGVLHFNEFQKKAISEAVDTKMLQRLKALFDEYPNYSCKMKLTPELLSVFSDEELMSLKEHDIPLFEKAAAEGIPSDFKSVLAQNPKIRMFPAMIQKDIFQSIPVEDLSQLSEQAMHRISHLVLNSKFYSSDSVYKLQKRSRRVAALDKVYRKIIKPFYS